MSNEYGMWGVSVFMVTLLSLFVIGFFRPRRKREWRSLGIFEGFIVALYAEMYGFPLTIYILSTFFGINIPLLHTKGHLWASLFNLSDKWASTICMVGSILMISGLIIMGRGWRKIYKARGNLVTEGLYARIRHPQYLGLILLTTGMMVQWPTILTIIMWPALLFAYWRLAKIEEDELQKKFGQQYADYKARTGMFLPSRNFKQSVRSFASNKEGTLL